MESLTLVASGLPSISRFARTASLKFLKFTKPKLQARVSTIVVEPQKQEGVNVLPVSFHGQAVNGPKF
jgi:hypothetical protein